MTGSPNEDLEQEVYIKTWKNLPNYKEKGSFKGWISTITANLCRDYLKSSEYNKTKKITSDETIMDKVSDEVASLEDKIYAKQRQKMIIDAIENLKPKYKEVVIMYEMQGLNYEEISKKLKCPTGTVRSRLYNARKELSVSLQDLL